MKLILLAALIALAAAFAAADSNRRESFSCNGGRGCNEYKDTAAECQRAKDASPFCNCSAGFTGYRCIPQSEQEGKVIEVEETFKGFNDRAKYLEQQKSKCKNDAAPFLCPPTPPTPASSNSERISNLQSQITNIRKTIDESFRKYSEQCRQCASYNTTAACPTSCNPGRTSTCKAGCDYKTCVKCPNTYNSFQSLNLLLNGQIATLQQQINALQAAPPPPSTIYNAANANQCVANIGLCFNISNSANLIRSIDDEETNCAMTGQKFCRLIGCVSRSTACVPSRQCPDSAPVRCPIFATSTGGSPCVAVGTACPTGVAASCPPNSFLCPDGLTCAPGNVNSPQFYSKCMGTGNQTMTSTWNGCPANQVACPGRPFVCVPVNGSQSVQQLCDRSPGPFFCPAPNTTFCGYRRSASGSLMLGPNNFPTPICLPPSSAPAQCGRPGMKPIASNFTFGLPVDIPLPQSITGQFPDGSSSGIVAVFGTLRTGLPADMPAFFTGDGTQTSEAVSFVVGPIADSVAQFGPFATQINNGVLLSPVVSITPSQPVVINIDATALGGGLYMSIVLSDQGSLLPSGLPSLSVLANCQAAVATLAVYSIESELDAAAVPSAPCIAEVTTDTQLCRCKFLVPHFSAFAVVDTNPSSGSSGSSGPAAAASASTVAASITLAAAAAAAVLL